jgi:hypothetical protein
MNKKSFFSGLTAMVLAIGVVLAGCEGPTGADGASGGGGGTEGWAPAPSLAAAEGLFKGGITRVYLSATDGSTGSVIEVPSGATLWVPVTAALGTTNGGVRVKSGGTLLVSAAATLATGGVEVQNGGTLTVRNGGSLIASDTAMLTVGKSAVVTVQAGGTLSYTASASALVNGGTSGTTAVLGIKAAHIGGHSTLGDGTGAAEANAGYGDIAFAAGAWYKTNTAADLGSGATAGKAFDVSAHVVSAAAFTGGALTTVPAGKTLQISGTDTLAESTDVTVAGTLIVGAGSTFTVAGGGTVGLIVATTGEVVVDGGSLVSTANAAASTTIQGSGKITAGDIVISGAGTVKNTAQNLTIAKNSVGLAANVGVLVLSDLTKIDAGNGAVVLSVDTVTTGTGTFTEAGNEAAKLTITASGNTATISLNAATTPYAASLAISDKGKLALGANGTINQGDASGTTTMISSGSDAKFVIATGAKLAVNLVATGSGSTFTVGTGTFVNGTGTGGPFASAAVGSYTASGSAWSKDA